MRAGLAVGIATMIGRLIAALTKQNNKQNSNNNKHADDGADKNTCFFLLCRLCRLLHWLLRRLDVLSVCRAVFKAAIRAETGAILKLGPTFLTEHYDYLTFLELFQLIMSIETGVFPFGRESELY